MKWKLLLFAFIVGYFNLTSCNNDGTQSGINPPVDSGSKIQVIADDKIEIKEGCPGISNFYIHTDTALSRIKHFKDIYHDVARVQNPDMIYFVDSAWIDAGVINKFSNFLDATAPGYDGVRIVSIENENNDGFSNICLVPTTPKNNGRHKDEWGKKINANMGDYTFKNFNFDDSKGNALKKKFAKKFRKKPLLGPHKLDSLSESVWVGACVFLYLSELLKDPTKNLDGVRVYFSAYYKDDGTNLSQDYHNQSTVIIAPTRKGTNDSHNTDWDAVQSKYFIKRPFGALNHGQLCPNNCN